MIASGRSNDILLDIHKGHDVGTYLYAEQGPVTARKQWLASHLQLRGKLILDAGACRVIREKGGSLLAVGVRDVAGQFRRGEVVACIDEQGQEVARGLVNYNSDEISKLLGQPSDKIESILGYVDEEELIHRDNMIISS